MDEPVLIIGCYRPKPSDHPAFAAAPPVITATANLPALRQPLGAHKGCRNWCSDFSVSIEYRLRLSVLMVDFILNLYEDRNNRHAKHWTAPCWGSASS